MFDKRNFCHIASNNRNDKQIGVFVYKTSDSLAQVSVSGYFSDKLIDINLHDLIIHEYHNPADRTEVQKNLLCVVERTLTNVGTKVIKSKWEGDIETEISAIQDELLTFVKTDGSRIMTAPLKFMSGSVRGAVGPYFNGVGFWKLDSQGNLTQIASISDSQFIPTTTETIDLGNSTKKWKNLYLGGKAYIATINNGYDISVPNYAGTMIVADFTSATAGQILALDSDLKPVWQNAPTIPTVGDGTITITQGGDTKGTFTVNQSGNTTIDLDAGGSGSGADLFDWKWADHELDDTAWLRADTFSWQPGSTYEAAYKHLRNDMYQWYSWEYNGTTIYTKKRYPEVGEKAYTSSALTTEFGEVTAIDSGFDGIGITVGGNHYDGVTGASVVPTTETIAGVTVQYIPAADGHKIVTDFHTSEVEAVYAATGMAWYYIIDYGFYRFKLPRSKHEHYGDRPVIGNGKGLGVTGTGSDNYSLARGSSPYPAVLKEYTSADLPTTQSSSQSGLGGDSVIGISTDATKSGIISTPVQDTDQYKYLYFYVGEFTQTAIENTAGLNAEDFNDKADTDFGNTNMIDYVVEKQEPNAGNGYTWYRKYKSGWVEQGGHVSSVAYGGTSIVFPVVFADNNYQLTNKVIYNSTNAGMGSVGDKTTAGAKLRIYGYNLGTGGLNSSLTLSCDWEAVGVAA